MVFGVYFEFFNKQIFRSNIFLSSHFNPQVFSFQSTDVYGHYCERIHKMKLSTLINRMTELCETFYFIYISLSTRCSLLAARVGSINAG